MSATAQLDFCFPSIVFNHWYQAFALATSRINLLARSKPVHYPTYIKHLLPIRCNLSYIINTFLEQNVGTHL